MKRLLIGVLVLAASVLSFLPDQAAGNGANVYVIPIKDNVEKGLYAYLDRAITIAEENEADLIIFDMDTPGGAVDAASDIGKRILQSDIKTVTFVNPWAISAGSYIALYSDEIYMAPNAVMGATKVVDSAGNAASEKVDSMWIAAMEGAAKQSERNPDIAKAMASTDVDLPELKKNGTLLTLHPTQAIEVGYSEGTVKDMDELLKVLGYEGVAVQSVPLTFVESLARFITDPVVVPILLSIASIGLVLELYSPGFGLPGGMGISALLLFFYGHFVAGLAGYESLILFVLGIILIGAEFFLSGGIAGILGTIAVIGSILMAGANVVQMAVSVIIALFLSVLFVIIMVKVFGKRMNIFKKLILTDSTSTEDGYVSNVNRLELIGQEGITSTPLRPAGTVKLGDERLDVVAEGGFIESNVAVIVIKVEGSRIVVREK